MDQPPDKFALELAGPGVEPETVDTAKLLAFAAAYFDLIRRMGSDDDAPIAFHGLEIVNKCVAVRATPNDLEHAKRLATASTAYLQGGPLPSGLKTLVEKVRDSFSEFEGDYTAKVIVGQWEAALIAPEPMMSLFPVATETMRAIVLRVGGASPRVRVRSMLDGDPFSIDLTSDQAQALAPHLYKYVDIVIRAMRTGEGKVVYCQLLEFTPVIERDSVEALDEWFRPHAGFWDQVKDISQALGRPDRDRS